MPLESPDTSPLTPPSIQPSGFGPLRIPLFRDRWIASTVSSLGTWMQDTAGTWLMTSLTASPLLIALMQTAASLPVLFLGLLAGATADIFDRRRLLIFWQGWMLGSVAILALLTFLGHISPWALLAFTFLLNIGSAMNNPAWQAIVPELVPRELIPDTVSLNAASNNLARAVGPAIGGLMVAAFKNTDTGSGFVFLLNALSFAGVIWVLVNWKRTPLFKSALPSERIAGSIRSGLRYVRYSPPMQASLLRAFIYTFFVSAVWSLLAVVAAQDLKQGALGYGILNGSLGIGALIAATQLPKIRRRFDANTIIAVSTLYNVCVLLVMAWVHTPWIIIPVLVLSGSAWTSTMSTLNTSVQLGAPGWVTARALGTYLMTFQGGMALGSVLWGFVAEHSSTRISLTASAAGLLVTLPFAHRFKILQGPTPDHTPYQWKRPAPEPVLNDPDEGPIRVSIVYTVPLDRYDEFTHAIHALRGVRLRDGAIRWGVFRDALRPELLNETFIMESWIDYLRSRERMTADDQRIRDRVWAIHAGDGPPVTSHQIYAKEAHAVKE
ncbi:Predicted arabinose efflux permease, MFS family [Granulicella rosea]|uniref:Predicted arabinose efflux permease, MFS family n=1 Tax=Granulicella rosea TaxID=474952 RepID=A0A239MCG5_9BACT|nr:MFS transporter [Granulicella rosea]SNT40160.1 Predicted arabinose efflux permease, MFS family [Granulicella rosea]